MYRGKRELKSIDAKSLMPNSVPMSLVNEVNDANNDLMCSQPDSKKWVKRKAAALSCNHVLACPKATGGDVSVYMLLSIRWKSSVRRVVDSGSSGSSPSI